MKLGVSPDTFPPRSHEAKRISVVDAAASVFCREGYAGANIDLIAAEAGVSRQTVYNHHGDKEKLFMAVVRDLTERCNAGIFATIATFPDQPIDLEADLVAFAVRMNRNCICNRDGRFLRKLIQAEGERYPELFAEWREQGPGRTWSALAARFARLAHAGHLSAELQITFMLGGTPTDEEVVRSATTGVGTFVRAFGSLKTTPVRQAALAHA